MAKFLLFIFIAYVFNGSSADKICSDPNEEYKLNIKKCEKDLCSSIVSKFACDPKDKGQPGCFCKSGFLRLTQNSSCIPTKQCPELANSPDCQNTTCGENEIMNSCPLEKCEYCPTCDEEARACVTASQDSCPPPKCTCRNNYRRLQNRTCIPTRQCPSFHCPRPNEAFDSCPPCPTDSCSRATPDGSCKVIGHIGIPLQCRPSCRCKKNYWRDGEHCVPYESCPNIQNKPQCNLPNESLKCVKQCPPSRTCKNRHIQFSCFNNETEICKHKCVCNVGFYRNEDGHCVTSSLCDKKCTGPHEVYTTDKKNCLPDICKSIVSRYACGPNDKGQPGCVCKSGFLRLSLNSTCIPMEQCPELANSPDHHKPKCNLPNESLKCLKKCPPLKTCKNRNIQVQCLFNETEVCKDQCVCNDGYYRNEDGYCVTSALCDKKCSGLNEIYKPNKTLCPPQTCQSRFALYKCDSKEIPQPGCVCKPGYLRLNANSSCIPSKQCPESNNSTAHLKCSLPNESPQCVRPCPPLRTCENRNKIFECPLFNSSTPCKNVCACNKGFYRNSDGLCVTSNLCDKCTKPNESLKCVKSCPRPRTCIGRHFHYKCFNDTEVCKNECVCDDGYYRNEDGYCVTSALCDKKCSGINEIYKPNKTLCPPQTCQSRFALYKCDPKEIPQPGCVCKPGYLRLNANSSCIPSKQCPESNNSTAHLKCSLPNESPQCVRPCPPLRTCENRNKVFECPMFNSSTPCKNVCACNKGFYRNSDGLCVTSDLCDKCTKPNESLKCVKSCPRPRTCIGRHFLYKCFNDTEVCKNECVCDDGFYRNEDGYCVTSALCDKKCSGINEIYKPNKTLCPPQTCQSRFALYKCDPKEIPQPGCVCKPGYLRLNANSSCIPSKQCPESNNSTAHLKCSLPNESPQCVRPCPPLRTCENRNKVFHCPMFNSSTPCKNVCACNKGFYRNSDGHCVTSDLCDKCTKPNESLKCVKSCPRPRTCIGRHLRYKCFNDTEVCKNECVCDDGFYRNSNGFCVTSNLCDKKCLGLHEEYTPNKKSCSPDICRSLIRNYKCGPKEQGQPGCVCQAGYLRMTLNSPCVPKEECPEFGTTPDSGGKCGDPDKDSQPSDKRRPVDFDLEYWFVFDALPGKQIDEDAPSST